MPVMAGHGEIGNGRKDESRVDIINSNGGDALAALREAIPGWDERIEQERRKRLDAAGTNQGGDRKSEEYKSSGKFPLDSSQSARADSNGISDRTQRKLDRLAKDRPDLLARVKSGELSTQAAAIEAGIVHVPTTIEKMQRLFPTFPLLPPLPKS